jgi:tRNA threonylcarbamoyladenosine biosynthesis protein TsaB
MTQAEDCIPRIPQEAIVAEFDRVLILETSGRAGQVALASGETILAEERLAEARRRASDLASTVDRLLKQRNWRARELTAAVVGLGPGSYTGLRVGLASAKALAYAAGCRFFGVETFAAIAVQAPPDALAISVIADALKGKLFHRDYRRNNGLLTPTTPLRIVTADDWRTSLAKGAFVSGPAAAMFGASNSGEPRPVDMLAVARTCPWAVNTDVWRAEPLYLRGSSAEEKAAGKT